MVGYQRFAWVVFCGLAACGQASQATSPLPTERTLERGAGCAPGYYFTTSDTCSLKIPGNTPGPSDTATQNFSDGCVSGVSDPNHYCVTASFGEGDCDNTSQCAWVLDTVGRAAGCDPTAHTCSVPGCGPGSYVGADGLCHDKIVGGDAAPTDVESPADGCVSGALAGVACASTSTGGGDCWFDSQCADVATDSSAAIGCMPNHHCGPTSCAAGYYVTKVGTCALKIPGWNPAPLDTLSESLGGGRAPGCVSGTNDANNYCPPPSFGSGSCASTDQCANVVDEGGRAVGCDPTAHTCSVPGCGSGSYVGTDGLCHDKVASGDVGPGNVPSGNPGDGCVSGSLAGVACAPTATGSGDCWDAAQCAGTSTENAAAMGCMANLHCGPTSCAPGYYVTKVGTCSLKIAGWNPAPLDTLSESLGGGRAPACVSGANDGNNYCVPPSFGAGDCAFDAQCASIGTGSAVLCDTVSHTCSVCQNGTYATTESGCADKIGGGSPAPTNAQSEDPAAGCVSGAVDDSNNCTVPSASSGDCYSDAQCQGVTATNASSIGCRTDVHNCGAMACSEGSFLSSGTCLTCTVCQPGERQSDSCTGTADTKCISCAPGTFSSDAAADTCTMCAADTYSGLGAASCTQCDADAHALPGSNACTHCELGTAYEDGDCTTCDAGSYAADGATSCTQCPAGTYAPAGAGNCFACDAGTSAPAGSSSCTLCLPGTYADTAGAPECTACPEGTLAPDPGTVSCQQCPSGQYFSEGACVACTVCGVGERRDQACTATADTVCVACTPGTFAALSDSETCEACPANTYSAVGAPSCTACASGFHAAPGSGICSKCDAGAAYAGGTCNTCNAGSAAADGELACLPCGNGTFAAAGATTCSACAAGTYAHTGAAACQPCAAGTFADTAGAQDCQACPAGSVSDSGAATCTACAAGTFAIAGAATCTVCGSCDDGNDCTTDACDPERGCTHLSTCVGNDTTNTSSAGHVAEADIANGAVIAAGGCSAVSNQSGLWLAIAALIVLRRSRAKRP